MKKSKYRLVNDEVGDYKLYITDYTSRGGIDSSYIEYILPVESFTREENDEGFISIKMNLGDAETPDTIIADPSPIFKDSDWCRSMAGDVNSRSFIPEVDDAYTVHHTRSFGIVVNTVKEDTLPPGYTFVPLRHGLELRPSSIEGNGLFSSVDLPAGFVFGPSHIKVNGIKDDLIEYYHEGGLIRTSLGGYVNHSLTPNTELVDKGNYYVLVSIRKIEKDEELTLNYFNSCCGVKCENGK